jgi:2-polyprenyl-3-methyl-5-hydroxy-6-metoxy-1,4-benzoquinol methylase
MKRCVKYTISRLCIGGGGGGVLDYGCGTGVLISALNKIMPGSAVGYEPIMTDRYQDDLPIYSHYNEVEQLAPYNIITIFEVLEHLSYNEIKKICLQCNDLLCPDGVIIISVPIEIGPAVLLKQIHRLREGKHAIYSNIFELIRAAFLGIPGERFIAQEDYNPFHKGFDFRKLLKFIESIGFKIKIIGFSPLPIKCWYGNSQIFFMIRLCQKMTHTHTSY